MGVFYQAELNFLCNTLAKCRIKTTFINPHIQIDEKTDIGLKTMLLSVEKEDRSFYDFVNPIEEATIYKLTDHFRRLIFFFFYRIKGWKI